jgi:cell pole-organizing protein PopZ
MGDMSHEPSMEEILSSIKKIIAEDGDKPMNVPRVRRTPVQADADGDVLELTEAVAEATSVEPVHEAPVTEMRAESAPAPEAPKTEKSPEVTTVQPAEHTLLAEKSATASRNAFAQLSTAKAKPAVAPAADLSLTTIESMVTDMLRPMLKDWLDTNLPSVVEKMVAKEIARIRED